MHQLANTETGLMTTGINVKYIKVHTATRWTIRHSSMLHWFADLMNVTEEVTIHRRQEANRHRHDLKGRGRS